MEMNIIGYETDKAFDYENGFYLTSQGYRIHKLLAHYETYKKIIDLPGEIIELGVFKGTSLIRFATFREALETNMSRKIIGFDAYGQFPVPENASEEDISFIKSFELAAGMGISKDELYSALKKKGYYNIELIQGNILKTLPEYFDKEPQTRIALLHIDVDVYDVTYFALSSLYKYIVPGGIIILDDYGLVEGGTRAIDEFIHEKKLKIHKSPLNYHPSYITMPA